MNGPFAGKPLHWLLRHRPEELLGATKRRHEVFPLLVKLIDAADDLSVQVGKAAAQANVAVYSLFLDRSLSTPFQAQTGRPIANMASFSRDSAVMGRWLTRPVLAVRVDPGWLSRRSGPLVAA